MTTDFGFYGKYVESSTTKYAGLFYDASTDNTFRLFADTQTEPSTTVNTTATGYTTATLVANITGNVSGSSGSTTGNAATATTLQTARTIHGVSFNGSANIDLTEQIQDTVGALLSAGTNMTVDYQDGSDTLVISTSGKTQEEIEDIVGAMFSSNTETGITVTYQDSDGTLDFNVNDPTISLTGDVTGSATMTDLGNTSISTTIAANSVALGTDTTGNYVAGISGTSNEIEVSGSGSETATVTVGLPDDVTIGNDLTVTGDASASNLTLSGNLTVQGSTTTVIIFYTGSDRWFSKSCKR